MGTYEEHSFHRPITNHLALVSENHELTTAKSMGNLPGAIADPTGAGGLRTGSGCASPPSLCHSGRSQGGAPSEQPETLETYGNIGDLEIMGKDHRTILELLFGIFKGVTIGQDVEKETLAISWRRLRLNMGKICELGRFISLLSQDWAPESVQFSGENESAGHQLIRWIQKNCYSSILLQPGQVSDKIQLIKNMLDKDRAEVQLS